MIKYFYKFLRFCCGVCITCKLEYLNKMKLNKKKFHKTLEDFAGWSGLHMNREKTQLFHAGLSQIESNALTSYGFTLGSLPIRYLGLPLMCRKLKVAEHSPLIEKISARFNSWAVRSLSFAGRVQLIASVISGIINFWISTFILPLGCIRRIESLCSRFLWSGRIDKQGMVKIAWSQVCLPKVEGGLGLRICYLE